MPELPEVETARLTLKPAIIGHRVQEVEVREARLRKMTDEAALKSCVGDRILDLRRRGKYLLFELSSARTMIVHLGMTGNLCLYSGPVEVYSHQHVIWHFDSDLSMVYRDPRRFGMILVADAGTIETHPSLSNLGAEPLNNPELARQLQQLAQGKKRDVKDFLLDQHNLAGIGNIYASEALFKAGIRPTRGIDRLRAGDWKRLSQALQETLEHSIAHGGTTLQDFRNACGQPGHFQFQLLVYDRESAPCYQCNSPVKRMVQHGRSSYFCAKCQK